MAEPALRHIDLQHLAHVVASSDDAIVSKDLDGTIRSWNPAAERMFGYSSAEAIGRSIRMLVPADKQSEEDLVLDQIRRGESVTHLETVRQHRDGTIVHVTLTVSPVRDETGTIVGASKIARDISERTRLRQLAEEQALIATKLSEVGKNVASSLDRDAIMREVVEAATVLTHAEFGAFFCHVPATTDEGQTIRHVLAGASAEAAVDEALVGRVVRPLFNGASSLRLDDVTSDSRLAGGSPFSGTTIGLAAVKSLLSVQVCTPSGERLGWLSFGHSKASTFTEQHEHLAIGISSWASLALENSRLYVRAREADRLKDEFLAVLSHELRTPLNAILGYARLLRAGIIAGAQATRGLDALERNAMALTHIVEDILDISRIISGKIRFDVQAVELPLIIGDAVSTAQPAADAKGITLQVTSDPHAGPISGDPNRLQQIVWNLLSNAIKFTPKGGRVQVQLQRVSSHIEIVIEELVASVATLARYSKVRRAH